MTSVTGAAATSPDAFVVPLDRIGPGDLLRVGGKALGLSRLMAAHLPVPPGFCITTVAFRQFLAGSATAAASAAARAREQLMTAPLPPAVEQAIVAACEVCGSACSYAVRSSATAEDLPGASFAGQYATYLNVRGRDALLHAVRACWASLYSDRACAYRAHHGLDDRQAAMAVVVQELVPADVSGVTFTADPLTASRDRVVIEATYGLGEALVSGRVTPDRIVLDRPGLHVLQRQVGTKSMQVVPRPDGGVSQQTVPSDRAAAVCLDDDAARHIAALALRAEEMCGGPQDVEWAVHGDRRFLLQSRPITVLPVPSAGDRTVWSNVNAGEVMPDVLTPMSWAVADLCIRTLFSGIFARFGVRLEESVWFKPIAGRVYANVSTFAAIVRSLPGPVRMDLNEVFGGEQGKLPPEALRAAAAANGQPVRRWRVWLGMPWLLVWFLTHTTTRRGEAGVCALRHKMDELMRVDLAALPEDRLTALMRTTLLESFPGSDVIAHAAVGMGFSTALYRFTKRWLGDANGAVASRLISGAGNMDTAEAALDLWRLAAEARELPDIAAILTASACFAAAHTRLARTEPGRQFLARWDGYMFRHGHHTRGEVDVYNPRWSERPDYVLDLLRGYLVGMGTVDALALREQRRAERTTLVTDCRRRLGHPLLRLAFDFVICKAQRGLALRENFKSEAVRAIAVARRVLLELGQRLARRGVLRDPDDVFFLDLAELEPVQAGRATFDVAATIATRRAEHARNRQLTPPPVIIGRFNPDRATSVLPPTAIPGGSRSGPPSELRGLAVSPGLVTGRARVILRSDGEERVLPGEILVAPFTDPGWTPYFLTAAAVVMDMGGMLSHGSIVAREYGLPAVVNVGPATQLISTGQWLEVDGNRGVVRLLGPTPGP